MWYVWERFLDLDQRSCGDYTLFLLGAFRSLAGEASEGRVPG